MAEVFTPGVTLDELVAEYRRQSGNSAATAADMFATVMAQGAAFVSPQAITTASLLADYPANAARLGYYARVSDLYGAVDEIVRCRYDSVAYRWVPQREGYNATVTVQGGGVSLVPLVTAPTIRITANALTSNMVITPSTANAYVGQEYEIVMPALINLGLFTTQIAGLLGSNLTLLAGQVRKIQYGATGWFQAS